MTDFDDDARDCLAFSNACSTDDARDLQRYRADGRRHAALASVDLHAAYVQHASRLCAAIDMGKSVFPHIKGMQDVTSEIALRNEDLPEAVKEWFGQITKERAHTIFDQPNKAAVDAEIERRILEGRSQEYN